MRRAVLPIAFLAAACQPGGPSGIDPAFLDEDLEMLQQEVIMGSETWDHLTDFDGDPTYGTGALYGRASGRSFDTGCSGFLIDDAIWVNATHCRVVGDPDDFVTTIRMGDFGDSDTDDEAAFVEARARLRALGIPAGVVEDLPLADYTQWVCDLSVSPQGRDVEYWTCQPNTIEWDEGYWDSDSTYLDLLPGHVWGHYNVRRGPRPESTPIYLNSYNRKCGEESRTQLLSPGTLYDTYAGCSDGGGFSWGDECFDHSADSIAGSSGGVIADLTDNTAFGVVHGSTVYWFGDPSDPCESWTWADNDGSYIGPEVDAILAQDTGGNGWPVGPLAAYSEASFGGSGGSYRGRACPEDMLVGGVLGTTAPSGYVGNFGLVCIPHNSKSDWRLDRAEVLVTGSIDTDFVHGQIDLNTYLHESTSSERPGTGVQHMVLCPPGYFVNGLGGMSGDYVGKLAYMNCQDPQSGHSTYRLLSTGDGSIGERVSGLQWEYAGCPEDSYYTGMYARAGWLLDRLHPFCRYED